MSYDFLFFKLRKRIASFEELSEDTTKIIDASDDIRNKLDACFSDKNIEWSVYKGIWSGQFDGDDTWYDIVLREGEVRSFSVRTSYRTNTRLSIAKICDCLGVIALDTQTMEVTGKLYPIE